MTTIRPMTLDDVPAVYRLGEQCYDVHAKPYNYWTFQTVVDYASGEGNACHVAEEDGRLVGFVLCSRDFGRLADTGYLEWVAVSPDHRGRGLASSLIAAALDALRAAGARSVVTDVADDNHPSRALMASVGFRPATSYTYYTMPLTD